MFKYFHRCLTLTVWYFLSQLCTYTPGKYKIHFLLFFFVTKICFMYDFVGLVFYRCGDIYNVDKSPQKYIMKEYQWNETAPAFDINKITSPQIHNQTDVTELVSSNNFFAVDRYM